LHFNYQWKRAVVQSLRIVYRPLHSFFRTSGGGGTPAIPNNQIPLAMISPVASKLFASSLYPTAIGTSTQLQQNSVNNTASAFNVNQGDIKADFKATDKDTISGRFTGLTKLSIDKLAGTAVQRLFNFADLQHRRRWTRLISTSLVNDARIGWSHVTLNSGNSWLPVSDNSAIPLESAMVTLRVSTDFSPSISPTQPSIIWGPGRARRASMTTSGSSKMR